MSVETYLLCQWYNHQTPACTAPTPLLVNIFNGPNVGNEFTVQWSSSRDPLLYFLIYYGFNPGGPYNGPGSPVTVAANLRTATIPVPVNDYFVVVTAVDSLSPSCQASMIEQEVVVEI